MLTLGRCLTSLAANAMALILLCYMRYFLRLRRIYRICETQRSNSCDLGMLILFQLELEGKASLMR